MFFYYSNIKIPQTSNPGHFVYNSLIFFSQISNVLLTHLEIRFILPI